MRAAIDALPEKYRTVITLYHLQGKQYEEIADVLGLPMGTVKTHLFRAKEQLRKLLGASGGNRIMNYDATTHWTGRSSRSRWRSRRPSSALRY